MTQINTPPHNFDAEQSLVGGLMLRPDAYYELDVSGADFYGRPHRLIFDAIETLIKARNPVDIMTIQGRLDDTGMLEDAGGLAYLIEVAKNTPSAANIAAYAKLVRGHSDRRFAMSKLQAAMDLMVEPSPGNVDQRFSDMGALLSEIDEKRTGGAGTLAETGSEIIMKWLDMHEERIARKDGEWSGFTSGIAGLDELLYPTGISKTALIAVGARPKMGKTTFLASVCNHVLLDKKLPVLTFSLEMTSVQLFDVMISQAAKVSGTELHVGADQSKMDLAYAIAADLGNSKLHIADKPGMTLHEVVREARRIKREAGEVGLICIDYLTLMRAEKSERNDLAYGEITKGLKGLAKEIGCPVLLLTQLNRKLEDRSDKRPTPSDSRDTGQIEQDCDIWIGLYRDEVYNESTQMRGVMEMLVRLHRGGATGTAYSYFHNGVMRPMLADEAAMVVVQAEASQQKPQRGWVG